MQSKKEFFERIAKENDLDTQHSELLVYYHKSVRSFLNAGFSASSNGDYLEYKKGAISTAGKVADGFLSFVPVFGSLIGKAVEIGSEKLDDHLVEKELEAFKKVNGDLAPHGDFTRSLADRLTQDLAKNIKSGEVTIKSKQDIKDLSEKDCSTIGKTFKGAEGIDIEDNAEEIIEACSQEISPNLTQELSDLKSETSTLDDEQEKKGFESEIDGLTSSSGKDEKESEQQKRLAEIKKNLRIAIRNESGKDGYEPGEEKESGHKDLGKFTHSLLKTPNSKGQESGGRE